MNSENKLNVFQFIIHFCFALRTVYSVSLLASNIHNSTYGNHTRQFKTQGNLKAMGKGIHFLRITFGTVYETLVCCFFKCANQKCLIPCSYDSGQPVVSELSVASCMAPVRTVHGNFTA